MLKKILSIILVLSFVTLSTASVTAQTTDSTTNKGLSYLVYDKEGKLIEEGAVPNRLSRYTWTGITLQNGQTVKFVPSHNSNGFLSLKGTVFRFGFRHNFKLGKGSLLTQLYLGNGFTNFMRTYDISPAGHYFSGYSMLSDGYLYAQITNYSSDSVVISDVYIEF